MTLHRINCVTASGGAIAQKAAAILRLIGRSWLALSSIIVRGPPLAIQDEMLHQQHHAIQDADKCKPKFDWVARHYADVLRSMEAISIFKYPMTLIGGLAFLTQQCLDACLRSFVCQFPSKAGFGCMCC